MKQCKLLLLFSLSVLVVLISCDFKASSVSSLIVDSNDSNDNNPSTDDSNQLQDLTQEEQKKYEDSTQAQYSSEADGAPARPTWQDAFRHYPEGEFFRKGRYVLLWRKDPGNRAQNVATKWELYQITFNNPSDMLTTEKWGKNIAIEDIKDTTVIHSDSSLTSKTYTSATTVVLPTNLLPADLFSTEASTSYTPIAVPVSADTQVGYFPITLNEGGRNLVVAYKIRVYRDTVDTDDHGNLITKELYNDSQILMVSYREGKVAQITGVTLPNSGGGSGSDEHVPDTITDWTGIRSELGFSSTQNFATSWETNKMTTSNVTALISKADYLTLFPNTAKFHDLDGTYYTYENFVEAAKYFPKFLGEGSTEDKYRELAAFLGNKSHETGDGWPALGADRWKYGLVWIVELSALQAAGLNSVVTDKNDLYKAYLRDPYLDAGNTTYPPTDGKSYHGRGPVQLSWNYNYGAMSQILFGDKSLLLENPDLVARDGLIGWASAIWFWMQPQGRKPSAHDVMVGNVRLSTPYTVPVDKVNRTARSHLSTSIGTDAAGNTFNYHQKVTGSLPAGVEVGFGLTINIINGGLESNIGNLDNRQARRIAYFAKYLDYFGTTKMGKTNPISPQVSNGDTVPTATVNAFKNWSTWIYMPADGADPSGSNNFPKDDIPSIIGSQYQMSF